MNTVTMEDYYLDIMEIYSNSMLASNVPFRNLWMLPLEQGVKPTSTVQHYGIRVLHSIT